MYCMLQCVVSVMPVTNHPSAVCCNYGPSRCPESVFFLLSYKIASCSVLFTCCLLQWSDSVFCCVCVASCKTSYSCPEQWWTCWTCREPQSWCVWKTAGTSPRRSGSFLCPVLVTLYTVWPWLELPLHFSRMDILCRGLFFQFITTNTYSSNLPSLAHLLSYLIKHVSNMFTKKFEH